ncbi:MAG: DUF5640 domain-containing protein [Oscillospiraceae bacterium]
MKKYVALFLIAVTLLTLAACGSKDALAGTWSADLGDDGVITWTFNGKGKCTMENAYMKQDGTYTIDGDQLTVTLEAWSEPSTYTFSVDGSSLTMKENSGYGISGTAVTAAIELYITGKMSQICTHFSPNHIYFTSVICTS